jgi:hypothetical protein
VQFAIEAHELPELLGAFEELKLMLEPERRTLHRSGAAADMPLCNRNGPNHRP